MRFSTIAFLLTMVIFLASIALLFYKPIVFFLIIGFIGIYAILLGIYTLIKDSIR